MKILFVTSGLGIGGAERMLQKIVMEIQKQYPSAEVRVVSLGSKGEIGKQLESKGVWVCGLNLRSGLVEVFRGFYLLMKESING